MSWNWKLTEDGTLQIFNDRALYWEIDNCKVKNDKELEDMARQAIQDFSYLLADI